MARFFLAMVLIGAGAAFAFQLEPAQPTQAKGPRRSDAVVKAKVAADKPDADGKQALTLTLAIDKGWHIYANPVCNESLARTRTEVSSAGKALEIVSVDYPAGKLKKEEGIGEYRVYEDTAVIKVVVRRGERGPGELNIKVNACDANQCLPSDSVKVVVAE